MRVTTRYLRSAALIAGLLFGMLSTALAGTVQRPISDFLSTQGTFCFPDGSGGCLLFVPPDPNFIAQTNDLDSDVIYFAGVDYAGLALPGTYPASKLPKFSGSVIERSLPDGRAEVSVLLHTKNANAWVMEFDPSGDFLDQVANRPTVFGHRPADVRRGSTQALVDIFLHLVFTNTAPGAPLPDLVQLSADPAPGQVWKFIAISAEGNGPLTAEFGVPANTPGKLTIVQTGLLASKGQGLALQDAFPAEDVNLRVVGTDPKAIAAQISKLRKRK